MPSLVERYRAAAKMMRKYNAASLEASELDEGADRIAELEGEVDRLVRINKSFGAEIKRLRKLKGEPDNWSPTLDKGEQP